jgi:hypothetical protein
VAPVAEEPDRRESNWTPVRREAATVIARAVRVVLGVLALLVAPVTQADLRDLGPYGPTCPVPASPIPPSGARLRIDPRLARVAAPTEAAMPVALSRRAYVVPVRWPAGAPPVVAFVGHDAGSLAVVRSLPRGTPIYVLPSEGDVHGCDVHARHHDHLGADPHAVMIDQQVADREHLRPGGTLYLIGYPQRDGNPDVKHEVRLAFRVSAVVAFNDQIVAASYPRLLLSPAFARTRQAMSFNPAGGGIYVLLRPRADAAAFTRQATALAARYEVGNAQVVHLATTYAAAQRSIRPQAAALAIFAGLAGLIALAIMGQLLSRQLVLDSAEFPILRALGMSRPGLVVLSLARAAAVTTAGAAIAVGVAIAASPLMPIGPARFAEPDPGVEINLAVLGAGFVVRIAAVRADGANRRMIGYKPVSREMVEDALLHFRFEY